MRWTICGAGQNDRPPIFVRPLPKPVEKTVNDTMQMEADMAAKKALKLRAAFLLGWDSALIQPRGANNPYRRCDFVTAWANGRRLCLANEPLPNDLRYPWRKQ